MKPIALSTEAASLPKTSLPGVAAGASAQAPFDLLFALIAPVADTVPAEGDGLDFLPVSGDLTDAAPQAVPEVMADDAPLEEDAEAAFFAPVFDFMQQVLTPVATPGLPVSPVAFVAETPDGEPVSAPEAVLDGVPLAGANVALRAPEAQSGVPIPNAPAMIVPQGAQTPEITAAPSLPASDPWMVQAAAIPVRPLSRPAEGDAPVPAAPLPVQDEGATELVLQRPETAEVLVAPQAASPEQVMPFAPQADTTILAAPPQGEPALPVGEAAAPAPETGRNPTAPPAPPKAAVPPATPQPAEVAAQPVAQPVPAKLAAPLSRAATAVNVAPSPSDAPAPTEAEGDLPAPPMSAPPSALVRAPRSRVAPLAEAAARVEPTVSDLTEATEPRPRFAVPELAAVPQQKEPVLKAETPVTGGVVQAAEAPASIRAPAPAAPPPPSAPLPETALNMRQNDWGRQLLDRIERVTRDGSEAFEISLRPKTLGALRINLEVQGERTSVHFVTETASAARMLLGSEDKLSQLLDQSGFRLGGFSAHGGGAGGQNGQPQPHKDRTTIRTGKRVGAASPDAAQPAPVQGTGGAGVNMLA